MKRTALLLAVALVAAFPLRAEDPDFAKLQQSYKNAVEKAVKPINDTYIAELRKLLEKQTKAAKLDDAKVTMAEIETLIGKDDGKLITTVSDKEFEKLIIGRTWKHVMGSRYTFKKDGEGFRTQGSVKTPFLWRVSGPNMVEVTGKLADDGTFKTYYNRILSLNEAYYGPAPDSTNLKLTLEN